MLFLGQNNENARAAFEQRALYKENALEEYNHLNLSDFLYNNPLYGKIDRVGNAIFPNDNFLIQYASPSDTPVFGLDFVVRAYENFYKSFIIDVVDKNGMKNFNSTLINIFPQKGFQSIHDVFQDHTTIIFDSFIELLNNNPAQRKKICNYKKFLNFYFWFIAETAKRAPVTQCGFIKSRFCPPNISGLIVEIDTEQNCGDDTAKQELFFNDPLFDNYLKSAVQFGFSVDKNVPWRLVARPYTSKMKFFRSLEDPTQPDFFKKYYLKSYLYDYNDFKLTAQTFYESFVAAYQEYQSAVYNKTTGKTTFVSRIRPLPTESEIDALSERTWLKNYFHIRLLEKGKKFTQKDFKRDLKTIYRAYNKKGIYRALAKMELMLRTLPQSAMPQKRKQMFDYGVLNNTSAIYSGKLPNAAKKTPKSTSNVDNIPENNIPVQDLGHVIINNGSSY